MRWCRVRCGGVGWGGVSGAGAWGLVAQFPAPLKDAPGVRRRVGAATGHPIAAVSSRAINSPSGGRAAIGNPDTTPHAGGRLPPGGTTCQRGVTVGPRQGRGEQRAQPTTTRAHAPPSGTLIRGAGLSGTRPHRAAAALRPKGPCRGFRSQHDLPWAPRRQRTTQLRSDAPSRPRPDTTRQARLSGARGTARSAHDDRKSTDNRPPTPRGAGNCATSPHRARAHPRPDRTTP
ncbi:hypothetical protein QFZ24_004471 [Streptomyces phaeochromogenes]|nr:hypothetical protein [Streptomyces phaeochromogenes]